jgi:hypothetical protein
MNLVEVVKDPTVEVVKQLISELQEIPMNKSLLVLKQKNVLEEAQMSGIEQRVTKMDLDKEERRILRPMYVLSVSSDSELNIQPLDMVRSSRLTELTGVQIPCSIEGYKIILVRDYDVMTVIKNK